MGGEMLDFSNGIDVVTDTLTHWGRVTHICVGKLTIIGWDNGLSPGGRQAIIWTNAGLLSTGPLWTYFSEYLIKIQQFSLKTMHLKVLPARWGPPCLSLNVLNRIDYKQILECALWVMIHLWHGLSTRWSNLIPGISWIPKEITDRCSLMGLRCLYTF